MTAYPQPDPTLLCIDPTALKSLAQISEYIAGVMIAGYPVTEGMERDLCKALFDVGGATEHYDAWKDRCGPDDPSEPLRLRDGFGLIGRVR